MSTLKVSAINNPSAPSGGLAISSTGVVTGPGLGYIAPFSQSGVLAAILGNSRWYLPMNCTITGVYCSVGTAPTGGAIIIDVNLNGTTIFTTQANRPSIPSSGFYSGLVTNMNVTAVTAGSYISIDVDQIGATVAGSNLSVVIQYVPA
jgi:hypothetical protein